MNKILKLISTFLFLGLFSAKAQDTWQMINPTGDIPSAREGHSMVPIDSLVYLFGGQDGNKSVFNQLTVFDPAMQIWDEEEPVNSPPTARSGHKAIVKDGKMYVFFGTGSSGVLDDIWEYNPAAGEWTQIVPTSTANPVGRYDHSAILVGNKAWIVGGMDNNGNALSDLWAYNFSNGQWESYPDITGGGTYGHTTAQKDGYVYVFGGYHNDYLDNAIYKFNPGNNSWSIQSPQGNYPNPFAYCSFMQLDDKVFLFGGQNSNGTTSNCYEWDLTNMQFNQLASDPGVSNASATIYPESFAKTDYQKFILFGGSAEGLLNNNTWLYTSTIVIPVGINESEKNHIKVYPNPASDFITIDFGEEDFQTNELLYQVSDIKGKVLKTGKISAACETLNLSGEAATTYLLRILQGKKTIGSFKIMKQ